MKKYNRSEYAIYRTEVPYQVEYWDEIHGGMTATTVMDDTFVDYFTDGDFMYFISDEMPIWLLDPNVAYIEDEFDLIFEENVEVEGLFEEGQLAVGTDDKWIVVIEIR